MSGKTKDVSVVFKASNQLSKDLREMKGDVRDLSKEVNEYRKIQQKAFQEEARIRLDIKEVKASMKELEKEMKGGSETAKAAWLEQTATLAGLNSELKSTAALEREAAKYAREMSDEMSKMENRHSGGTFEKFASSGLKDMLGSAVSDFLGSTAASAFGSSIGEAITSIGGGIATGAALGGIPGAVIGGTAGAIQATTAQMEQMNDLYRDEVKTLYDDATSALETEISSGSSIAAEREMYQRTFQSTLGKDAGDKLFEEVKAYGDRTVYDTTAMLGSAKEMLSYGIAGENIGEMMSIIGDIAGGNTNSFSGLSYAIAQSMNSGTLNGQDRRQMVGWGFDPLEFIAKDLGIDRGAAAEMMSAGKITSEMLMDALRLAVSEGERFFEGSDALSDTFEGRMGQLDSAWADIEAAAGEAYNKTKGESAAKQIDMLTGESSDALKKAYEMAGAYEAEMEAQREENYIRALENAAKMAEEQGLEGIEAQKAIWEAKAQAEIEWKNSEEMEMKYRAEQSLVESIQQKLIDNQDYLNFGKAMADQFSLGYNSNKFANLLKEHGGTVNDTFTAADLNGSHASGLVRVPYDGYRAELHEGEQVLTRAQAEERRSGSITIAKLADSIVVREDADIDRIASALVNKLMDAKENYVGV